jgi:polyisoprenoid-binding protein YceI
MGWRYYCSPIIFLESEMLRNVFATTVSFALLAAAAHAQGGPPAASKDPATIAAGTYVIDPSHTSVLARVPHMNGVSTSVFRFGTSAGSMIWDPTTPETSKLDVTIDAKSIETPVKGFADELVGAGFLNAAKYPEARFVSTSIKKTGPAKGEVSGDFTFMGQTHTFTLDTDLVGSGKNMRGAGIVGFHATGHFKRSDYGFGAMAPAIGDEITLVIDTEMDKK